MENWSQTLSTGPLLGIAAAAVILILVLVIKVKMHAFFALIIASLLTALATGIPLDSIVNDVMIKSFGETLGPIALLIGLGAVLGRLIESSGGARVIAERMVDIFGEDRAAFALGVSSLFLGFPIFFDAGLVVMLPIIFAVARRIGGNNLLLYGFSGAVAFSVMHVFLPPHPGPVAAADTFEADLGVVMLLGLIVAVPTWYVTGYLWAKFINSRYPMIVPNIFGVEDPDQPENPPSLRTVLTILILPIALIFMNTSLSALGSAGKVDLDDTWVKALMLIGTSQVALLISAIIALLVLGRFRGVEGSALEKLVDRTLGSVAAVILITGAGGMFGGVLRASGVGDALSQTLSDTGMPLIFATYLIAVILRVAQGSATVALVTTAGVLAPAVATANFGVIDTAAVTLAAAAGSAFAGHVNDSGFWLVGRLMDLDVKTTLKTWTVQQALESVVGFALVLAIYAAF
ncbi:GntP family permease [Demetria terragena]|uniref:GntP family permease n=1 Tax=Demetria terragena TaxID=63959 RepID=UPI000362F980|nr:GntP family permease [Demetria terragena]